MAAGVIVAWGDTDIDSPSSALHGRDEIGVPEHGAHRSVDTGKRTYVANVRALPPLVTEVILSDRSCVDDAARQLRERLADDPRVRVLAEPCRPTLMPGLRSDASSWSRSMAARPVRCRT